MCWLLWRHCTLYMWMQVIILWRRDKLKLSFDSLEDGWFSSGDELEQSRQRLFHVIDLRLHSTDMLPFAVQLPQEFIDEHAKVCYSHNIDLSMTAVDVINMIQMLVLRTLPLSCQKSQCTKTWFRALLVIGATNQWLSWTLKVWLRISVLYWP